MKVKGICSRCERRRSRDPRKLTPLEKAVVVILAVYAFGTILPDFGRLIPPEVPRDWGWCRSILGHSCYPLGTLGFQADNDGKITQVDNSGPAWKEGIREGDVIDLSSPKTERRAVNQFVFVAIGQQHSLQLLLGRKSAHDVPLTLNPVPEQLSGTEWWSLHRSARRLRVHPFQPVAGVAASRLADMGPLPLQHLVQLRPVLFLVRQSS